jgi:uncharacterized membrane protein YqjE
MASVPHSLLLGRVRLFAATAIELLDTRVALLAVETEQQIRRLLVRGMLLLSAVLTLGLACLFLGVLVLIYYWDDHRLLASGLVTLTFLGVSLTLFGVERYLRRRAPGWFAMTRQELADDAAALRRARSCS